MDRVHCIESKPWISQRKFHIKELVRHREFLFKEHRANLVTRIDGDCAADQQDEDSFEDLSQALASFETENEKLVNAYFMFNLTDEKFLSVEPKCKLKMYELQLQHAKLMISDRYYKVNYLSCLKTTRRETLMRHLASLKCPETRRTTTPEIVDSHSLVLSAESSSRDPSAGGAELIDSNGLTVILVVQIWPQPNKAEKLKLEKEVHFRSDQFLTDLRDYFKCQRDYGVPMDLSNSPEQQDERVFRGELFKSGFFLIEDTFYNDLRDINNIDLSAPILEWASTEVTTLDDDGRNTRVSRGVGPFNRTKMEETRFEDLTIRLGYPYLYYHQGNCEHLFTFSDIRYIPKSAQSIEQRFPRVTATAIGRKEDSLRCYMCKNRPPHWYTRNNNRLPVDPFFFCEQCFLTFNYDKDKKKIGQFQAFLYTSASGIPDSIVMGSNK